jgi:hypothetical protein
LKPLSSWLDDSIAGCAIVIPPRARVGTLGHLILEKKEEEEKGERKNVTAILVGSHRP